MGPASTWKGSPPGYTLDQPLSCLKIWDNFSVTFEIKPGAIDAFMPLMMAQARTSLDLESDCQVFDVCRSEADVNAVFLYEVYTDRAAFDVHLASPHFQGFDAAVADMVKHKTVATFLKA